MYSLSIFKPIFSALYFKKPTSTGEFKVNINPSLDISVLTHAFEKVMERIESSLPPSGLLFSGIVGREPVPVKTKIKYITNRVYAEGQVAFDNLFEGAESRSEIVAIFLAVLELVRNFKVSIGNENGEIYLSGGDNV
jgi:segregation and condensation protein A